MPGELIVGVVRRPFGLHGDVFVHPDPDLAEPFEPGSRYALAGPQGGPSTVGESLTVSDSYEHDGRQVVRFAELGDRDSAARARDHRLLRPSRPGDLDDDAHWAAAVVGLEVVDTGGTHRGVVESLTDGHAHDYLVVAVAGGGRALVPAVAELVRVEADRVVVEPLPGLLDGG